MLTPLLLVRDGVILFVICVEPFALNSAGQLLTAPPYVAQRAWGDPWR